MREIIGTEVIVKGKSSSNKLEFVYESDSISLVLDGKTICEGDWTNNFYPAFKRMLALWEKYE